MLGILEKISPSELVSNGYISNHDKVWRPRPKFKVSFFPLLFLNQCYSNKLWKHQKKIQRIISDNCFQLKWRFNVDARAPSIPLLNFPFKVHDTENCCIGIGVTGPVSFRVAEVSCPKIFFIVCPIVKWFCPNSTCFLPPPPRKWLFEKNRGGGGCSPPPRLVRLWL